MTRTSWALAPGSRTLRVEFDLPNPDGALVSGQYAHVTVLGIDFLNSLLVPQRAVLHSASGPTVYVIDDDGARQWRGRRT